MVRLCWSHRSVLRWCPSFRGSPCYTLRSYRYRIHHTVHRFRLHPDNDRYGWHWYCSVSWLPGLWSVLLWIPHGRIQNWIRDGLHLWRRFSCRSASWWNLSSQNDGSPLSEGSLLLPVRSHPLLPATDHIKQEIPQTTVQASPLSSHTGIPLPVFLPHSAVLFRLWIMWFSLCRLW